MATSRENTRRHCRNKASATQSIARSLLQTTTKSIEPRAARTSPILKGIPSKFLSQPRAFVDDELQAASTSLQQPDGFTKITLPTNAVNSFGAHATAVIAAHKTPAPPESLPNLPIWAMHLFAGLASFVIVVAIVLYLAQFPPSMAWRFRLKRKLQGYTKIQQEDREFSEEAHRGRSSAAEPAYDDSKRDGEDGNTNTVNKRKPRDLKVNTRAGYRGLGIAVPGDEDARLKVPKRQSLDEEALRLRAKSPMAATFESLTAPIPSFAGFVNGLGTPSHMKTSTVYELQSDVESGRRSNRLLSASSPDILDNNSPLHQMLGTDMEVPRSAFLKRVNDGISSAADKLSRAFHDQVNGPEEGLLLPVHSSEREKGLVPGIFVD